MLAKAASAHTVPEVLRVSTYPSQPERLPAVQVPLAPAQEVSS
jgi:hypothetical protein